MLSANVDIPIVFGGELLTTITALVTAGEVQGLNMIGHSVSSRRCLATNHTLELDQTLGSFNPLNAFTQPSQVP